MSNSLREEKKFTFPPTISLATQVWNIMTWIRTLEKHINKQTNTGSWKMARLLSLLCWWRPQLHFDAFEVPYPSADRRKASHLKHRAVSQVCQIITLVLAENLLPTYLQLSIQYDLCNLKTQMEIGKVGEVPESNSWIDLRHSGWRESVFGALLGERIG